MSTTTAFRLALVASALFAAVDADAKPRRVTVLDFDGPRGLADQGKAQVLIVLSEQYGIVGAKTWVDAKASAGRKVRGPQQWSKASKAAGVDAVIEGWVQDEGRNKVLTLVITDASNGDEKDELTIKIGAKGFTSDTADKLRQGIEDRFEWIESTTGGNPDPLPTYRVKEKTKIGARQTRDDELRDDEGDRDSRRDRRRRRDDDRDRDDDRRDDDRRDDDRDDRRRRDDDVSEKEIRVAKLEVKETKADREQGLLVNVFRPVTEEEDIVTGGRASHVPKATSRFSVAGGFFYGSRTLYIGAENPEGVTQYAGVPSKGLAVEASFYPFPHKKIDGILSGIGFSFGVGKALGSLVTFDDQEVVGDYVINQTAWNANINYRSALGTTFAIHGSVGYGQSSYVLEDAPMTFEVPNTAYSYLSIGGGVDLSITDRATVGFGAKYLYTLGTGDLSSTEWYGPGGSGGMALDGNFSIPLPSNLYIKGELSYTRIKTTFDGVGTITEEEGVSEAVDSTVAGNVKIGISF